MTQMTKKTLRGVALAIAECFGQDVADVKDTEYQAGRFPARVYTPFGDEYYTATTGKDPFKASTCDGWVDMIWQDVTPIWYAARFNNRVFVLRATR